MKAEIRYGRWGKNPESISIEKKSINEFNIFFFKTNIS